MIRPLNQRVLIQPIEPEQKSQGGIYLPEQAQEKPHTGTVQAVAEDCEQVKLKETIVFAKYSATEIRVDGTTYYLVYESDVLGVIE